MEYNDLEDLLFSGSFRNWVLRRDTPDASFWENWQAQHPEKADLIRHAKAIIYALQLHLRPLSEEEVEGEIKKTVQRLRNPPLSRPLGEFQPDKRSGFSRRGSRAWALAAGVAGLCILAWSMYRCTLRHPKDPQRSFRAGNEKPVLQQASAGDTAEIREKDRNGPGR